MEEIALKVLVVYEAKEEYGKADYNHHPLSKVVEYPEGRVGLHFKPQDHHHVEKRIDRCYNKGDSKCPVYGG